MNYISSRQTNYGFTQTTDFPKKKEGNQPFFKTAFGSAFKYALSFADSFV